MDAPILISDATLSSLILSYQSMSKTERSLFQTDVMHGLEELQALKARIEAAPVVTVREYITYVEHAGEAACIKRQSAEAPCSMIGKRVALLVVET